MPNAVPALSTLLLAFLLLMGAAALGQAPDLDSPRFFLETITVENAQSVSPEIVISESLLAQGVAYSEEQLRAAVHRITRLPFILDASFRLEKGTLRDSYQLVIAVQETRKWFFGLDGVYTLRDEPSIFDDEDNFNITRTVAGRRFSIGKYGVLFAALASENEAASLGYTHYNLANRGIILDLSYALDSFSSFSDAHRLSVRTIVPLRTNQSLRFGTTYLLDRQRSQLYFSEARREDFGDRSTWSAEAAWNYNSLDDPIFPTSGLLAEGRLLYARTAQDFFLRAIGEGDIVIDRKGEVTSETSGIQLQARNHWPVSRRHTLFAGVKSSLTRTETSNPLTEAPHREIDLWRSEVTLGHAMLLLDQRRKDSWRELRWETEIETTLRDQSPHFDGDFTSGALSTGLAYRNGWGVFRLVFQYVDLVL